MVLTPLEEKVIEALRAMQDHDVLVIEKKDVKNPTAFRLELRSTTFLPK
jgi:hypothetical protein